MLKVALIQLMVATSKSDNLINACSKIKLAADEGAKLICLPECFNCPYGLQNFPEYCENIPYGTTCQTLSEMAKKHSVWLVGGSIPESRDGKIYNSCAVYNPNGDLIGTYSKIHLFDTNGPDEKPFKESDGIAAGDKLFSFKIELENEKCVKVGIGICHDVRFPDLAHIYTWEHECGLLLYPGAFNMETGLALWELLGRSSALDNQCYVGLCSISHDRNAQYVSYGHSLAVDPWGRVIHSLDGKEGILMFDLYLNEIEELRSSIPIRKQRREDIYTMAKELKDN